MSTGYGYSDATSSGEPNNIQKHHHFLQSFHEPSSTTDHVYMYNLSSTSTGMENIINGFHNPAKNLHTTQDSTITSWNHVSNIPCEGNPDQIRPTQGRGQLSLSLSSSHDPSNYIYGLQSSSNFDLSQSQNDDLRFGPPTSRSSVMNIQHHPQVMMQEHLQIRHSKYLDAVQELLNEFCNLGVVNQSDKITSKIMNKVQNEYGDENALKKQSLYSLDLVELQKRKTKLLQMLQEVDRRYKHYCDQMKAVVQSFESVAGNGAARVYSFMASKAMSRHFRCLKDGILSQIKETKNAMGEKDSGVAGSSSKGETPRLRRLDQTLRQQRAFQQMNMMETHPWRPQRGLPERAVSVLRAWLFEHFLNPYPSDLDKHILARQSGLSRGQVSNWFINARVRLWKPMVEEMYLEDLKESQNDQGAGTVDRAGAAPDYLDENNDQNHPLDHEDQKPTIRTDSVCLSTIINNDGKQNMKSFHNDEISFGAVGNEYGAMQFGFSSSSYGHHSSAAGAAAFSYLNDAGNGGGGVSLTLGLHQNGGSGGGVSLAFSPTSPSSLFYLREQMGDCQTVQFSLLDSENQNLQYI